MDDEREPVHRTCARCIKLEECMRDNELGFIAVDSYTTACQDYEE